MARVGRPHGLRGEVALDVRTDAPAERLTPGATFVTDPAAPGPLTVDRVRRDRDRWFVTFAGVADRTAAEALTGVTLLVDVEAEEPEPDAWYPHQLVGLRVQTPAGDPVGEVVGLDPAPAHDLLLVREPDGRVSPVPFVRAIVPVVDVAGGRVVLDGPYGLLASQQDAEAAAGSAGPVPPDLASPGA